MNASNPATLYAGTDRGVFKNLDGGVTWQAIGGGRPSALAFALDPFNPATLYAGTYAGVFKSTDGGATWQVSTVPTGSSVGALALDPFNPATLYAGTGGGVFKSTDGGASWQASSNGLTNLFVKALGLDASNPATLYAGTNGGGVFKSTDGGVTWQASSIGLTNPVVQALALDPSSPATLYAGTNGGGVFKSTDGGVTWQASSIGLTNPVVQALALDPSSPATLYAGTNGGGVFKSTDGGANWQASSSGLTIPFVYALAFDPSSAATLYAGTYGGGVFKLTGALTLSKNNVVFPNKIVGTRSSLEAIGVRNNGNELVTLGTPQLAGRDAADFSIDPGECNDIQLDPGGECFFVVSFSPKELGTRRANIAIPNSTGDALIVALSGSVFDATTFPLLPVVPPGAKTLLRTPNADGLNGTIDSSLPTIVLTHGLSNEGDDTDGKLWTGFNTDQQAGSLLSRALGQNVNVLQYIWKDAFTVVGYTCPTRDEYKKARQYVSDAGQALAYQLSIALGPAYQGTIHFIGHSLGTAVNAYAAKTFLATHPEVKTTQVTNLDYPHYVNKISPNKFCAFDHLGDLDFQSAYGFDPDFFAVTLPSGKSGLDLRVDNYWVGPASALESAGVGTAIWSGVGQRVHNHFASSEVETRNGFVSPHVLDDNIFLNEGISNDHSGVHQWYRWTIDPTDPYPSATFPNLASSSISGVCNGSDFIVNTHDFNLSLNPCEKGWYWSLNGPAPNKFPSSNVAAVAPTGSDAVHFEWAIERGCAIQLSPEKIDCTEHSSPFAIMEVTLPDSAEYFSFDYVFANTGDGDYAAILMDEIPVWMLAGSSVSAGTPMSSGPIPIRGLRGPRTMVVALYGVGEKNASIAFSNFRTFGAAPANQAPTANAGANQTVQATSPNGAAVSLNGSASSDPDGDSLTYTWTGAFGTATGPTPTVTLPLGANVITLTVNDGKGGTATATVTVTITASDTIAPLVTYSGNVGTYMVDQAVNITCAATDGESGIASTTCQNVIGPAYAFPLGTNTFSAIAMDVAGNVGTGSTTFIVKVAIPDLIALTKRFVTRRLAELTLVGELKLAAAAEARGKLEASAKLIELYIAELKAVTGRAINAENAAVLTKLAQSL